MGRVSAQVGSSGYGTTGAIPGIVFGVEPSGARLREVSTCVFVDRYSANHEGNSVLDGVLGCHGM